MDGIPRYSSHEQRRSAEAVTVGRRLLGDVEARTKQLMSDMHHDHDHDGFGR